MARPIQDRKDEPTPAPNDPSEAAEWVPSGAIGARWKALGGKTWGLPANFGQRLDASTSYLEFRPPAGGPPVKAIFNSPRGAFVVSGDIWRTWIHRRSEFGNPTSDTMKLGDGGTFQNFERAQYVAHPTTGAFEVHGDILARYTALGGSAWGYPTTNETSTPDGRGRFNHFKHLASGALRSIYWTPTTGAWEVTGFRDPWAAGNWERGPLGYPTGLQQETGDKGGQYQAFERGVYVWSATTGSHCVSGPIYVRYGSLNGSWWGYPTSDVGNAKDGGNYGHFRHLASGEDRSILWHPTLGAFTVTGGFRDMYASMNWEHSHLGYPVADAEPWPEGGAGAMQQRFQRGRILRSATGDFASDPISLFFDLDGSGGFGGDVFVKIFSDGKVTFSGEVTNSAFQDYDYNIFALVRGAGTAVAMERSGEINMQVFGENVNRWSKDYFSEQLRNSFFTLGTPALEVRESHRGGITGIVDDILATAASWVVTGALGSGIVGLIYLGVELGGAFTSGDWSAGVRIMAGSMWMLGPSGYLIGMAVDPLARIGTKSRRLRSAEKDYLKLIFGSTVDWDDVMMTDTAGLNGRKFVFPSPNPGVSVNMNMGNKYQDTPNMNDRDYLTVLAHEATHVWQYRWLPNAVDYVLHGIFDGEYEPGQSTTNTKWSDYGIEQQATIVERWSQHCTPLVPTDTFGTTSVGALGDGWFPYIQDHIRVGRP